MTTFALPVASAFVSRRTFKELLLRQGADDWSELAIRRKMASELSNPVLKIGYRLFGRAAGIVPVFCILTAVTLIYLTSTAGWKPTFLEAATICVALAVGVLFVMSFGLSNSWVSAWVRPDGSYFRQVDGVERFVNLPDRPKALMRDILRIEPDAKVSISHVGVDPILWVRQPKSWLGYIPVMVWDEVDGKYIHTPPPA